ncbi:MAG: arsenate reductase (glutaredoxin) [Bacteroidia bacterium]
MAKTKITIYHNPRCGKSRDSLKLLESQPNIEIEVIEYLKNTPSRDELKRLLAKLNLKAEDIVRKNEALYKERYKGLKLNEDEWIKVLCENPILIERPIVVKNNKAVIGRPPENVNQLF